MRMTSIVPCVGSALFVTFSLMGGCPDDPPAERSGSEQVRTRVKLDVELDLQLETDSAATTTTDPVSKAPLTRLSTPGPAAIVSPAPNPSRVSKEQVPLSSTPAQSPAAPAANPQQSSVKKLALLVGINRYQYPEIDRLRGALNDVENMKKLLKTRFGFEESDIVMLTNEQATRQAIMNAFRDHLIAKTKEPGDELVVFHYSGHGSQRKTTDPKAENGWYETIVPHDSGRKTHPNNDIVDYELSELFTKLRANTRLITFIFDSCHSGDATRDIEQKREAPPDDRPLVREGDGSRGLSSETKRDYVMVSACRSDESAYEYTSGVQNHGTLTYFLVKQIDLLASAGATFQEVFDKVKIEVSREHPLQHPQIEGEGANREIFGAKEVTAQPFVLVSPNGDKTDFQAGQVQGMTLNSVFDVYPPGTRDFKGPAPAQFKLTEVTALTSKGTRVTGGAIEEASRGVERVHNYENERIRVYFDPTVFDPTSRERKPIASPLRDAVHARLEAADRLASGLKSVDREEDAVVTLRLGKDSNGKDALVLARRGNPAQTQSFSITTPDADDRVMAELLRWTKVDDRAQGGPEAVFIEDRNDVDALPSIRDRLEQTQGLAATFQFVDRDGSPDLVVRKERLIPAVSLIKADWAKKGDEAAISPPVREDEEGAVNHVVTQMNQWARWIRLSRLANPKEANLASFRVARISTDGRTELANDREYLQLKENDSIELTIKNESQGEIFVTILDLSSDGEVSVLYPAHVPKALPAYADDRERESKAVKIPMKASLNKGASRVRDELRAIVTKEPVDLRFLIQKAPKGIDFMKETPASKARAVEDNANPLTRLIAQAGIGQKQVTVPPVGLDDWSTISCLIEIKR